MLESWNLSVPQTLGLRARLLARLKRGYQNERLSARNWEVFLNDVQMTLPGIDRQVLSDSLWHLAGQMVTPKLLIEACWRLAGNVHRLRSFKPVPPWHLQKKPEWVIAQVLQARPARNKKGNPGAVLTFQILSGTSCPLKLTKFWSYKLCSYLARTHLGFARWPASDRSAAPASRQYTDAAELVSLRLELLIDPARCSPAEPGFDKLRCRAALLEHNKERLKYRDRLAPAYACPFGMPSGVLCRLCPKGYKSCQAGCHRLDYTRGLCPECCRSDAPFDADLSSRLCVECYRRLAMIKDP